MKKDTFAMFSPPRYRAGITEKGIEEFSSKLFWFTAGIFVGLFLAGIIATATM